MRDPSSLHRMTVEEYLQFDESAPLKHEYVAGEVYALSGVTIRHNIIALNVATTLRAFAGNGPCRVLATDVRLLVADDRYYYPDVMVHCGAVDELDVIVRDPCVVVEVTSPSTGRIDRGEKLVAYRELASLRAYLIVDHRRRRVERHWRETLTTAWLRDEVVAEGSVPIPCIDRELTLDAIYHQVALPTVGEPDAAAYGVGQG
jgi:Uma2 family endonuclease